MITEYFNATKIPFLEEVDLNEICDNRSLRKGIDKLNFFMEARNAALVYGRSGTGKTILLNKFLSQIQSEENPVFIVRITILSSTSTGILRSILRSLGETPSCSSDAILEQITNKVKSIDKIILLVFDDAQNLKNSSLSDLRVLCSCVSIKPIKLLLLGQTVLKDNLRNEMHTALKETLLYYTPQSFDEIESINYINNRLISSGLNKGIFSEECKRLIHLHSDGVPRKINNISLEVLYCAYTEKEAVINEDFFRAHQEEILI